MAAPRADSYTAASGSAIYGGRVAGRPAWRRAMSANTWAEIPSNTLSSVDPAQSATHNPNYPSTAPWCRVSSGITNQTTNNGVVQPWCGAAYDDSKARLWLPLGGGHGDYGGNESYCIDLGVDSPAWVMKRPPSGSTTLIAGGLPAGSTPVASSYLLDDGQETSGVYADGRPRAIHSYRKHVYVPGVGPVLPVQGGCFTNVADSSKDTWLMDEATGEWTWKSTASVSADGATSGSAACLDTSRGRILFQGIGSHSLKALDLSAWTYSTLGTGTASNCSGDVAITYVPGHDVIFKACDYFTRGFAVHDAATSAVTYPLTTGTPPSYFGGSSGQAWVPSLGAMVVLSGSGNLHTLTPTGNAKTDPWAWAVLATSAAPPTNTTVGVYTKFGYSQRLGGCYNVMQSSAKPWFFATE